MLQILIVDDNVPLRATLMALLVNMPGCSVTGVCSTVAEAKVLLNAHTPDLVLLDIELEDGTAFDLLGSLPVIDFKIIFITAFNDHAIKAIKLGALDYILKPVDEEELRAAISKAALFPRQADEQLSVAQSHMFRTGDGDRIALKEQNIIRIVLCRDILYCSSDNGYTTFFLSDGRSIMVSRSIKEYEKLLPAASFLRIHQSYIVNLEYIDFYNREGILVLKNGTEIPVSVRKREEVIRILTGL